jgi:anti-sigma B factor antagonist
MVMSTDCACRSEYLSGSRALVTASGELDLHTCPQFKKAIDAAARREAAHLLVDLSEVTFMDSTALGVLAAEQRRRSEPLHLVVQERQLLRLFEVTGFNRVFAIHSSLEDALLRTGRLQAVRARAE